MLSANSMLHVGQCAWDGYIGIPAYRHLAPARLADWGRRTSWCRRYETGKVMCTDLAGVSVSCVFWVAMLLARLWGRLLPTFKVIRGRASLPSRDSHEGAGHV